MEFHIGKKKLVTSQSLASQCNDNDILFIRKICTYNIIWNERKYECPYYTNIYVSTLLSYFLQKRDISYDTSDKNKFYFDNWSDTQLIPVEGISQELILRCSTSIL